MNELKKITILLPFFYNGGVERAMLNLAHGLLAKNIAVDFVFISDAEGPLKNQIPKGCTILALHKNSAMGALLAYKRYLNEAKPDAIIAVLTPANLLAIFGKLFTRSVAKVVVEVQISVGQTPGTSWLKAFLRPKLYRLFYSHADKVIAASYGIAQELENFGFAANKISVVHNPVVPVDIEERMIEPIAFPWFKESAPVIIAAGRLHPQKDFETLLRAFSVVRKTHVARLVIIGEGRSRERLQTLAQALGISNDVAFVGFVDNPYAYMHQATMFVLSSAWEGFGNVVAEALAVGTPVVSTDCNWGPREILQDGKYGALVSVGDSDMLAEAIKGTLENPSLDVNSLKKAAEPFTIPVVTERYIKIILNV